MKNCITCSNREDGLCLLHSTHPRLKSRQYSKEVDEKGLCKKISKIEFIGTEMFIVDDDFGCNQHQSTRTLNDLTNDEFLYVCGEKSLIMEDYEFNKHNYTSDEFVSLKKKKFINSLINPNGESNKMYFELAVKIYFRLNKIGVNL